MPRIKRSKNAIDLSDFFSPKCPTGSQCRGKWDTFVPGWSLQEGCGIGFEPGAVGLARIELGLGQGQPPEERHKLMDSRPGLDAAPRRTLAQAMRAATVEPGHATLPGKPIGKALGGVRLAGPRRQINQMSDRRRVDATAQRRQDRQFVPLDFAFATLHLGENKLLSLPHAAVGQGLAKPALHLRTEPDNVAAAYPGIEQ